MRVLLYWVMIAIIVVCLILAISDLVRLSRNHFKNRGQPFAKEALYCQKFQTHIAIGIIVAGIITLYLRHY
ncbi:hypothetical protein [Achromobacter sp. DH1f]|uniref:hypothetical protein n=1 Tax=Achromobacter sp. DH1f TaxID=1397275 RepID=UPI0012FEEEA8|nr:hypothetical protein [Achromobacter sp. DH1f]